MQIVKSHYMAIFGFFSVIQTYFRYNKVLWSLLSTVQATGEVNSSAHPSFRSTLYCICSVSRACGSRGKTLLWTCARFLPGTVQTLIMQSTVNANYTHYQIYVLMNSSLINERLCSYYLSHLRSEELKGRSCS